MLKKLIITEKDKLESEWWDILGNLAWMAVEEVVQTTNDFLKLFKRR